MKPYSLHPRRTVIRGGNEMNAAICESGSFRLTHRTKRWFRKPVDSECTILIEGYVTDSGLSLGIGYRLDGAWVVPKFLPDGYVQIDGKVYHGLTESQAHRAAGMYTSEEVFNEVMMSLGSES